MSILLSRITPKQLIGILGLTGLSVAAGASLIIHALNGRALDATTIQMITFLMGVILGNTTGSSNGDGTSSKV